MIYIIFLASLILRIVYTMTTQVVWWDASIYIGMGKYIFTNGAFGYFEPFRPLVMPLILGSAWKAGISPYFLGQVLGIVFSLFTLYALYLVGEQIKKNVGLYAVTLLSFTPLFFSFANTPLTDIPSAGLALFALYFVLKEKYWLAGGIAALAFLMRFPQALIIIPLSLGIISPIIFDKNWKKHGLAVIRFLVAFTFVSLPFFIFSALRYGDPLYPIKAGSVFTEAVMGPQTLFYYLTEFFKHNVFIIFSLVFVSALIRRPIQILKDRGLVLVGLSFLFFFAYYTYLPHRELRYGISFLPFICILAGYGLVLTASYLEKVTHTSAIFIQKIMLSVIVVVLCSLCVYAFIYHSFYMDMTPAQKNYYSYLKDTPASLHTSSPQMMSFTNIRIIEISEVWNYALASYEKTKNSVSHVTLGTCEMSCSDPEHCEDKRKEYLDVLARENTLLLYDEYHGCEYFIYTRGK